MDTQRTQEQPFDKLSVIIVDEDLCHVNLAQSVLANHEFQVTVYTNPIEALDFLKDHKQEVDFCLVAVNMKEMHGFQFLDVSRELHEDLQVIMMSADTTWAITKRCIELGARFLVKKPLDANTVSNLWQHLDLKFRRMERIKGLFKGIEGRTHDVNGLELEKSMNTCGDGTKSKKINLMWTPYLERKFASALELLGEAATPKKIQLVMDIESVNCKNISTHLQKYKKKIKKELCHRNGQLKTCEKGPYTCQYDPDIQPADEDTSSNHTKSFTEETEGNKVYYEAMQRALRLGSVFDELQICNDLSGEEANKGEVYKVADDDAQVNNTFAFGEYINVAISEKTYNINDAEEVISKDVNSDKKVSGGGSEAGVVELVAYSDSEDDEIYP